MLRENPAVAVAWKEARRERRRPRPAQQGRGHAAAGRPQSRPGGACSPPPGGACSPPPGGAYPPPGGYFRDRQAKPGQVRSPLRPARCGRCCRDRSADRPRPGAGAEALGPGRPAPRRGRRRFQYGEGWLKMTVRLTILTVADAEVVGHDQLVGQVGLVVLAVVAGPHDRVAVVVDDLEHLHRDLVADHLLFDPAPDGVDAGDLPAGVVDVGVGAKVATMASTSKALTASMCSATTPVSSVVIGCPSLVFAGPSGPVTSHSRWLPLREGQEPSCGVDSPLRGRPHTGAMPSSLAIGDFSRATHLSVKTLRHYHRVGLLEPADVDRETGYRRYSHRSDPGRPGDPALPRPRHAARRDRRGARRSGPRCPQRADRRPPEATARTTWPARRRRGVPPRPARSRSVSGARSHRRGSSQRPLPRSARSSTCGDALSWFLGALGELSATLAAQHLAVTGPAGGIYANELFAEERGEATDVRPLPRARSAARSGHAGCGARRRACDDRAHRPPLRHRPGLRFAGHLRHRARPRRRRPDPRVLPRRTARNGRPVSSGEPRSAGPSSPPASRGDRLRRHRRTQRFLGPGPSLPRTSSGFISRHSCSDRQPQPMQPVKLVAKPLQLIDPLVEIVSPCHRQPGPVSASRGTTLR